MPRLFVYKERTGKDMFINPYYLLFMLPAVILSLWAQLRVKSSFNKYAKLQSTKRFTGREAARLILDKNGLQNVPVERISGNLTDHYDPRGSVIRLSDPVFGSDSIAAIGVAAHEAGHAVQHKTAYPFIKIRMAIIPVCNIGATLAPFFIALGFILDSMQLYWLGIIGFCTVALFQLVTLPVEFNASRRAVLILEQGGILNSEELSGAKNVLSAAALTYVAALFTSLMQILYFASRTNNRR